MVWLQVVQLQFEAYRGLVVKWFVVQKVFALSSVAQVTATVRQTHWPPGQTR